MSLIVFTVVLSSSPSRVIYEPSSDLILIFTGPLYLDKNSDSGKSPSGGGSFCFLFLEACTDSPFKLGACTGLGGGGMCTGRDGGRIVPGKGGIIGIFGIGG